MLEKDIKEVLFTEQQLQDKVKELARQIEKDYEVQPIMLIGILRDVTETETARVRRESISRKTVEVADQVVEKQMRIVQEIASLLGETAAETKIALSKLKESITNE